MRDKKLFDDDLTEWETKVESVNDLTARLQSAVTYLTYFHRKLSGNIPSVSELKGDIEQLDNFLLSVSRALNATFCNSEVEVEVQVEVQVQVQVEVQVEVQVRVQDQDQAVSEDEPEAENIIVSYDSPEESTVDTFDMSKYDRFYSPILSLPELKAFKHLSFIIPENPRSIKRILNIYSLARPYRSYKYSIDTFDILSRKAMKFIIMLERWPYATSLMIEVITRLNYESDDMYGELVLDGDRSNCDKNELCDRFLKRARVNGDTDYSELKLYRLHYALEKELLRHNKDALRNILSRYSFISKMFVP